MGSNRNIVECKLTNCPDSNFVFIELIETLWNVNGIERFKDSKGNVN